MRKPEFFTTAFEPLAQLAAPSVVNYRALLEAFKISAHYKQIFSVLYKSTRELVKDAMGVVEALRGGVLEEGRVHEFYERMKAMEALRAHQGRKRVESLHESLRWALAEFEEEERRTLNDYGDIKALICAQLESTPLLEKRLKSFFKEQAGIPSVENLKVLYDRSQTIHHILVCGDEFRFDAEHDLNPNHGPKATRIKQVMTRAFWRCLCEHVRLYGEGDDDECMQCILCRMRVLSNIFRVGCGNMPNKEEAVAVFQTLIESRKTMMMDDDEGGRSTWKDIRNLFNEVRSMVFQAVDPDIMQDDYVEPPEECRDKCGEVARMLEYFHNKVYALISKRVNAHLTAHWLPFAKQHGLLFESALFKKTLLVKDLKRAKEWFSAAWSSYGGESTKAVHCKAVLTWLLLPETDGEEVPETLARDALYLAHIRRTLLRFGEYMRCLAAENKAFSKYGCENRREVMLQHVNHLERNLLGLRLETVPLCDEGKAIYAGMRGDTSILRSLVEFLCCEIYDLPKKEGPHKHLLFYNLLFFKMQPVVFLLSKVVTIDYTVHRVFYDAVADELQQQKAAD